MTGTASERAGVAVHKELRSVLADLQRHRGASTSLLSGKAEFRERVDKARSGIETALQKTDAVITAKERTLGKLAGWPEFKAHWSALSNSYSGLKPQENLKAHTEVIAELLRVMDQVADVSGLVLDPELSSYYMMDVVVMQLPFATERMGVGRATGSLILSEKTLSQERRDTMIGGLAEMQLRYKAILNGVEKVSAANAGLRERVRPVFEDAKAGLGLSLIHI